jgi:pseudo-rSAM protein
LSKQIHPNTPSHKDSEISYWFYLENYIHVSIKKNGLLFYNPLTGGLLEYPGNISEAHYQKIRTLVRRLMSPRNLTVIKLTGSELKEPAVSRFVNDTRAAFMADLVPATQSEGKPIQMVPILNIQKHVKNLKKESGLSVGELMMQYLKELSLHINNTCQLACPICTDAYKQFPCCTLKKSRENRLDLSSLETFFTELASSSLEKINILGGNIFSHPEFSGIVDLLNRHPSRKVFHTHYQNLIEGKESLKYLQPSSSIVKVLVPPPVDDAALALARDILRNAGIYTIYGFIIQEEHEYEHAEAVTNSLGLDNTEFFPFYNGNNLPFFRENIFMDVEEILALKPQLNNIHQNTEVNNLSFGRLTINADGSIHANQNAPRLGMLGKDSLYDILFKEMKSGKSWRRVRKHLSPCNQCTFVALCPPVSDYNYAIGRNDLCHKFRNS